MLGERDFVTDVGGRAGDYQLHVSSPARDHDVQIGLDAAWVGADLDGLQARVLAAATGN